jgi:L-lactate dehydrogenase complex protein LldG
MSAARDEVLARIRTALSTASTDTQPTPATTTPTTATTPATTTPTTTTPTTATTQAAPAAAATPATPVPATGIDAGSHAELHGYRARAELTAAALLDRLADRLIDYKCVVRRCGPAELTAAIAAAITERGARRIVLPPDLDLPLPDPLEVAVGSEWVVDNGNFTTYALDSFDGVITTATVAVAETGTIVLDGSPGQGRRALTLIPDYHLCVLYAHQVVGLVPEAVALLTPTRPLTWISGPSATSDIELDRVEGVHGPRTLEVILVN